MSFSPLALIAEDEPLLAQALIAELKNLWPELRTLHANNGSQAVEITLAEKPNVLFFDVRMPALSGLQAAAEIAQLWPAAKRLPALIFVTAYDEYAVQAFEQAALDYIVKPVKTARLKQTLERIQSIIKAEYSGTAPENIASFNTEEPLLASLRALLAAEQMPKPTHLSAPKLQRIQASVGDKIMLVPIEEVVYFEAADKYVRVLTPERELLIRTPLKDLMPQLEPQIFWQIHRGTIVNIQTVQSVQRDEMGKMNLQLKLRPEKLPVSRLYQGLFAGM